MGSINLTNTNGTATINDGNPTGNKVFTLPSASGTVVTTVNNTAPNAAGNVTLVTGKVLQVVQSLVSGKASTTSTNLTKLATSASITPTSSTSKIYVSITTGIGNDGTNGNAVFSILRTVNTSDTNVGSDIFNKPDTSGAYKNDMATWSFLDTTATTSPVTYSLAGYRGDGVAIPFCGGRAADTYYAMGVMFILMEIAA